MKKSIKIRLIQLGLFNAKILQLLLAVCVALISILLPNPALGLPFRIW